MKKKHLLGVILFFCVVLATIIFALDRMDVISEGVALFINVWMGVTRKQSVRFLREIC